MPHHGLAGIASDVAEEITHKDLNGDGKVGSHAASTAVNMGERRTGIDLNGDGHVGGSGAQGLASKAGKFLHH